MGKPKCRWKEPCCMRDRYGNCDALSELDFEDGQCHFRKVRRYGDNQYDARKKQGARA